MFWFFIKIVQRAEKISDFRKKSIVFYENHKFENVEILYQIC